MKLFSTNLLKEKSEGSVTVKTAVQNELHLNEWHLNSVVYVWTRLVTAVYKFFFGIFKKFQYFIEDQMVSLASWSESKGCSIPWEEEILTGKL